MKNLQFSNKLIIPLGLVGNISWHMVTVYYCLIKPHMVALSAFRKQKKELNIIFKTFNQQNKVTKEIFKLRAESIILVLKYLGGLHAGFLYLLCIFSYKVVRSFFTQNQPPLDDSDSSLSFWQKYLAFSTPKRKLALSVEDIAIEIFRSQIIVNGSHLFCDILAHTNGQFRTKFWKVTFVDFLFTVFNIWIFTAAQQGRVPNNTVVQNPSYLKYKPRITTH